MSRQGRFLSSVLGRFSSWWSDQVEDRINIFGNVFLSSFIIECFAFLPEQKISANSLLLTPLLLLLLLPLWVPLLPKTKTKSAKQAQNPPTLLHLMEVNRVNKLLNFLFWEFLGKSGPAFSQSHAHFLRNAHLLGAVCMTSAEHNQNFVGKTCKVNGF